MLSKEKRISLMIDKIEAAITEDKLKNDTYDKVVIGTFDIFLTEEEKELFIIHFFNLHKGYTKYKHLNLQIDYHKMMEKKVLETIRDVSNEANLNLDQLEIKEYCLETDPLVDKKIELPIGDSKLLTLKGKNKENFLFYINTNLINKQTNDLIEKNTKEIGEGEEIKEEINSINEDYLYNEVTLSLLKLFKFVIIGMSLLVAILTLALSFLSDETIISLFGDFALKAHGILYLLF